MRSAAASGVKRPRLDRRRRSSCGSSRARGRGRLLGVGRAPRQCRRSRTPSRCRRPSCPRRRWRPSRRAATAMSLPTPGTLATARSAKNAWMSALACSDRAQLEEQLALAAAALVERQRRGRLDRRRSPRAGASWWRRTLRASSCAGGDERRQRRGRRQLVGALAGFRMRPLARATISRANATAPAAGRLDDAIDEARTAAPRPP